MKAIHIRCTSSGEMYKIEEIPADLVDVANEYREKTSWKQLLNQSKS